MASRLTLKSRSLEPMPANSGPSPSSAIGAKSQNRTGLESLRETPLPRSQGITNDAHSAQIPPGLLTLAKRQKKQPYMLTPLGAARENRTLTLCLEGTFATITTQPPGPSLRNRTCSMVLSEPRQPS